MVVSAEALPSTGTRSTRASRPRSDHDGGTGGAVGVVASVVSPARSPPPSRVAMAAAREDARRESLTRAAFGVAPVTSYL